MADFHYVVADDAAIADTEVLFRRVPQWASWIVPDDGEGLRPSSMAFDRDRDGGPMSTFGATKLGELGIGYGELLPTAAEWALASITAKHARARKQHVAYELGDEGRAYDEAHIAVDGPEKHTRRLAKDAVWVIPPPAGWYPDPPRRSDERFWDGQAWTDKVRSFGQERTDPM